jgi:ribosomal protein L33
MEEILELSKDFERITSEEEEEIEMMVYKFFNEAESPNADLNQSKQDIIDEIHSIADNHRKTHEIISNLTEGEGDYINALPRMYQLQKNREETSDKLLRSLKHIGDHTGNKDFITDILEREKKARELQSLIDGEIMKNVEKKALNQADKIISEKRPKVVFEKNAIADFIFHAINVTLEKEIETNGYFEYELDEINGRKIYNLKEYSKFPQEHIKRKEKKVIIKEELSNQLKTSKDVIYSHFHPPGGQKSHSKGDKTTMSYSDISILGVPESKKQVWTVAQRRNTSGIWENLETKVKNGKAPRAHLKKYNKAIRKALAYKEVKQKMKRKNDLQRWQKVVPQNFESIIKPDFDRKTPKPYLDDKLDRSRNVDSEHWQKYLDTEKY